MKIGTGRIAAGVLCVLGMPLHLLICVLIKVFSPGPVLYYSHRLGLNGVTFQLLKYRTMRVGASPIVTQDFKTIAQIEDPRVTRLGRLLRCGIDEVPQLWNVVRGEMSWIGPRPDEDWMLPNYGLACAGRLSALPGITGLAQILDSRNLTTAEGYAIDLWYIERRNLWTDVSIVLLTPLFMAGWRSLWRSKLTKLRAIPEFQELVRVCDRELAAAAIESRTI
jgi:lipopolysaccharide/colanic/teichoic acid biosynthesis glycosyltransferase